MTDRARQAAAGLAATTVIWGSTFIVVRELVSNHVQPGPFPTFVLLAIRFIAAAGLMALALLVRKERIDRRAWLPGVILGLVTAGGFAFQSAGLEFTTSGRSAFITNISLLLVPLFGMLVGRPRPSIPFWAGGIVAMGGLYLLEFPWDLPPESSETKEMQTGDLLTIGCAVLFAIQILCTESYSPRVNLLSLVFVQFLSCGLAGAVFSVVRGEPPFNGAEVPLPGGIGGVVWRVAHLAVLATAACLLMQAWAQRYVSSTRAALIFMIEPVVAAILGALVLNEKLTWVQTGGLALIFGGVLGAEILQLKAREGASAPVPGRELP